MTPSPTTKATGIDRDTMEIVRSDGSRIPWTPTTAACWGVDPPTVADVDNWKAGSTRFIVGGRCGWQVGAH